MSDAHSTPGIDIAYCWDLPESPGDGLPRLRDYGFDGVELWPGAIEAHPLADWRKALDDCEMRCFQLCPYFDFVHGAQSLSRSRAELDRFLEYARALDCSRLRVFTGPTAGGDAVGGSQATPEQWSSAIAGLREFCDIAAKDGVELCLECHEGMLMEDSAGALRLLSGVKRENLTTNLQIPLHREEWRVSVDALGRFTTHMHIHNWADSASAGNFGGELTYISEGYFDWHPVLDALVRGHGRNLCLGVEHSRHGGKHESWETIRRDGPFLVGLRERVLGSLDAHPDPVA